MIQITIDNRRLFATGVPTSIGKKISDRLSYLQAGHQHTLAYQTRRWDGRRRLISVSEDGNITAPLGVAEAIANYFAAECIDYAVNDQTRIPKYGLNIEPKYILEKLRDYQLTAVEAATTPHGVLGLTARGILKMPPRAGKTLTAAGIIATLNVRTLFIVPSTLLLWQAVESLGNALGVPIGYVGNSEWKEENITVATIQTLLSRRGHAGRGKPPSKEYVRLLRNMDLLIIDECHHLSGDSEWRRVIQDSSAPYKIGLSATVFLDHERECELGVIWLRACAGEVLVNISTSDLIERGFLVRPEIRLYPIREPDLRRSNWSKTLQRQAIYKNPHRNQKIVDLALELMNEGLQVVVITNRVEQIGFIFRLLLERGPRDLLAARMTGSTNSGERDTLINAFRRGDIRILVSTVLDEGVDIPEIDAVINAEGGRDIKSTFQRMRCLTPSPGKTRALVVDFVDLTNKYFAAHSLDRLAAYKSESAFRIAVF